MIKHAMNWAAGGAALAVLLYAPPVFADPQFIFAKEGGNDGANCEDAINACATLAGALARLDGGGGGIVLLSPANYGSATINRSVSITAVPPQGLIMMRQAPTTGITIDAGPNDVVHIDGLFIDGATDSTLRNYGIRIVEAAAVHLRNCVIRNFKGTPGAGLAVESTVNVRVYVENCVFSNNDVGILVDPTAGGTVVTLDNVGIEKNSAAGITADGAFNAINGGKIFSFGNNAVASNSAVGTGIKLNLQ